MTRVPISHAQTRSRIPWTIAASSLIFARLDKPVPSQSCVLTSVKGQEGRCRCWARLKATKPKNRLEVEKKHAVKCCKLGRLKRERNVSARPCRQEVPWKPSSLPYLKGAPPNPFPEFSHQQGNVGCIKSQFGATAASPSNSFRFFH